MRDNVSLSLRLHSIPGLGSFCVLLERGYARAFAAFWRVNFEPLFDRRYYLSINPDVAGSRVDPLFHFLRFGAGEGRQPHPLFDPRYYLDRYPDVARSRRNPLLHFLRSGGLEGRCPHPDFDSAFYLARNPDVAESRVNPLAHFIRDGAAEGRRPHPDFDPDLYLLANPDVALAGLEPIRHFAEHGAEEGRLTRKVNPPPECFLPVAAREPGSPGDRPIDVVIPAYKGEAETVACLETVLATAHSPRFRIVVVNDCSPEPKLSEHLRALARDGRITLIENPRNLGFVKSVNAGMKASDRDVVLLNSDTLVFGDWLDRLSACAYAAANTGTVTPFSNNATICSYPVFCADNELPASIDLAALDADFASVNRGRSIDIPTAVGFCMYIRRDCLDKIGLFDAEAFGMGYGEENDFCMRASAKGWRHKLACDVFVYHAGSVSFGKASARQKAAMKTVVARHPGYPELVRRHVQADPAVAYRIAVTAQRIRKSGKRIMLSVIHALGGGVAEHVRQLVTRTREDILWLTLRPAPLRSWILECPLNEFRFSLSLDSHTEQETLATVIRACGAERIHLHHLMGHDGRLARLVQDLGLPFDFTAHDYYTICPQVTLSDERGHYCEEPDDRGCNRCIGRRPAPGGIMDISSWRVAHAWALLDADRVIGPSVDTAARLSRYYPEIRAIAADHPDLASCDIVRPRILKPDQRLRIGVLGIQTVHKGFELLQECADTAAFQDWPIEFILIGNVETGLPRRRLAFRETGPYEPGALAAIVEREAPHIIWFPGQIPETYSYTLSACLRLGLPVAAHELGSFPERLGRRPWSWILPHQASASQWINFFLRVRQDHFLTGTAPSPPEPKPCAVPDFYPERYLATATPLRRDPQPALIRRADRRITIAAAVASHQGGQIQACGYVRVIQPLTHPSVAGSLQLILRSPLDLAAAEADVILVQRVAIQDLEIAERLVDACRRRGSRLVFEIDDDLFHLPEEHPESRHYQHITKPAKWIAKNADAVLTSTETLRAQMLPINANTIVLPNYLDDRLWLSPYRGGSFSPDEIRILYAGTVSHRDDLEFFGKAVRKIRRKNRKPIRVDVVGVSDRDSDWFRAIPVPGEVAGSYPRFVAWIRNRNHWHWGVAPLLDSPFNRCKSALKFLEYSALDLASICSDVSVYRAAVDAGRTAILVANNQIAWRDALETVVRDEGLWNTLRDNSRAVVQQNTIPARAAEIKAVWTSIAAGAPANLVGR